MLLSRLCIRYKELFIGFLWLAVPFTEPMTAPFNLEAAREFTKATVGLDVYAYWEFFTRPGASEIIERNVSEALCDNLL